MPIAQLHAQDMSVRYYDIGSPVLKDIWVDPVHGNDKNTGATRSEAIKTLTHALQIVPHDVPLTSTGYRICLTAGDYPSTGIPSFTSGITGSYTAPLILEAIDGAHTARLHAYLDIQNVSYCYLIGIDIVTDPGQGGGDDVIHVAADDHILLRNCTFNGFDGNVAQPQETVKANQVQYLYIEDCDISNAIYPIDLVAVEYGHIQGNKVHASSSDCMVLKGGTAYFRVEGNEVYDCRIGIAIGQGTGFNYMVSPWLHYEAYDIKVINNIVHNTLNAGLAVRGGYNILLAFNTLYKVGLLPGGAGMFLAAFGGRACGNEAECKPRHNAGGWGLLDDSYVKIPNKHVYVYNNIFYNPQATKTTYSHFVILPNAEAPSGSNIPNPVRSDEDLAFKGNIIWNGPSNHPIGIEKDAGCQPDNPTCNETLIRNNNSINSLEPELIDPDNGNYRPKNGSNLNNAITYTLPDFPGNDRPQSPLVPLGALNNSVGRDADNNERLTPTLPGAYSRSELPIESITVRSTKDKLLEVYPNPTRTTITLSVTLSEPQEITIALYDCLGHTVQQTRKQLGAGSYQQALPIEQLQNGVYSLVVHFSSGVLTRSFVIQH